MSVAFRRSLLAAAGALLIPAASLGQGPGSCAIHLDLVTHDTSTYSSISGVPGYPGAFTGFAPGANGNPFTAYALPGTQVKLILSVPEGTLGPAYGAQSPVTLLYSVGGVNIPLGAPPGMRPGCNGNPWIISIFPLAGALADGVGLVSVPPLLVPSDPGYPQKFQLTFTYPVTAPATYITFQAALQLPTGELAVSNGVSLVPGSSPWETSLLPSLVSPCIFSPTDEGGAPVPTPSGFQFYGLTAGTAWPRTNGFIEFGAAAGTQCDFFPQPGGIGCPPTIPEVTPRIAVNHGDNDLAVMPPAPYSPDLTVENVPAVGTLPSRVIIRWKNVSPWYAPSSSPASEWASYVCELWGGNVPAGSAAVPSTVVVVHQDFHDITTNGMRGWMAIGPGDVGQGFFGPPVFCNQITYWLAFGSTPWYTGSFGAMHTSDALGGYTSDSTMVSNLAVAYMPAGMNDYYIGVY